MSLVSRSVTLPILALAAACAGAGEPVHRPTTAASADSVLPGESWFPPLAFHRDQPGRDEIVQRWYSRDLAFMREPRLSRYTAADAEAAYRLTLIPSFTTSEVVRLERRGRHVVFTRATGRAASDYSRAAPVTRTALSLPREDADAWMARVEAAGFWAWPTRMQSSGADGTEWVLEGYRDGRYHVVSRWSPDDTGADPAFLAIATQLLRVAGLPD